MGLVIIHMDDCSMACQQCTNIELDSWLYKV